MRKRVRKPGGRLWVSTERWPPFFSTRSFETHKPMPVPTSVLVVKKGSKMRERFSGVYAVAVVGNGNGGPAAGAGGFDADQAAGFGQCIAGVGDEVGKNLAEVVGGDGKAEVPEGSDADFGAAGGAARLEHAGNGVDGVGHADRTRGGAGAHEGEGAAGDGAEAGHFLVGALEVVAGFRREVRIRLREINEVGHGFERVVDLVGNGGGETSDGGELFGADEGGLGVLAVGDVDGDAVPDSGVGGGGSAAGFEPVEFAVGPANAEFRAEALTDGGCGLDGFKDTGAVFFDDEISPVVGERSIGVGAAEDFGAAVGPFDAAGVGIVHPGGEAAGLLGFHEGIGAHLQRSEGGAELAAGEPLAVAEESNKSADGEDDDRVKERLRIEGEKLIPRKGEVIEEEGGKEDRKEARTQAREDGDAGDEDEVEGDGGSVQGGSANAEDDADPGKDNGGGVTTDLDEEAVAACRDGWVGSKLRPRATGRAPEYWGNPGTGRRCKTGYTAAAS